MRVPLNFSIWISFLLQHGRGVRTSLHGSAPNDFLVSADWFFNHSQSFFRSAEINLCFVSIWNTAFYNADFVGRLRPLRCISKRNKTGQTEKGKTKAGIFRRTSKYRLFPLWEDLDVYKRQADGMGSFMARPSKTGCISWWSMHAEPTARNIR